MQNKVVAQYCKQLDSLIVLQQRATTDSEKVISLGHLADYYYIHKLDSLAANTLHQQLLIAELSNNKNLMLTTLFCDTITNIGFSATSKEFDKTIEFIKIGINYAKAKNLYDFIALGYVRMSNILRRRGHKPRRFCNFILNLNPCKKLLGFTS